MTEDTHTGLGSTERRHLNAIRRFGTAGALLLAIGGLGAGAAPVDNPLQGVRVLGLMARMPTAAMACAWTGIFMIVLSWLALGRLAAPGRARLLSRIQLNRTLVMWIVPLMLVPPMFSRDVYSYLAQGEILSRGMDPYTLGPADALGVSDPLTRGVPNIWRNTPSPYGPLFLTLGRLVTGISGDHVVLGILLQRLLALAGFAMIVWALPRLARRYGVNPVAALWLGAANPLVLFHLISGIHNESLMIGLMLVGFEIALSRSVIAGATLITLSAAVKVPSAVALGFLGVALTMRWGGRARHAAKAAGLLGGVFVGVTVLITLASGLGFGWIPAALNTPGMIRSWMSPVTDLGELSGAIGVLLGLGDHTDAVLGLIRLLGQLASGLICLYLLWICLRGRRHPELPRLAPLAGLGIGLGAVVLLGPVVHPWYLLWAAIPLAAATGATRFRTLATLISAGLAVVLPPTGANFDGHTFVVWQAVLAAVVVLIAALAVAWRTGLPQEQLGFPPA